MIPRIRIHSAFQSFQRIANTHSKTYLFSTKKNKVKSFSNFSALGSNLPQFKV